MPEIGWYGDDFTGATDTLATAAEGGLRAFLFLGVPDPERVAALGPLDAVGIAGAARTMAPEAMATELAPVGRFLAGIGPALIHYKCCSTFDSAPGIGSLGAAIRALRPFAANPLVAVVGGQPSLGRYCAFSTLFASAGLGGEVHRIDRHPTMSRHPVTPMGEADLRRHLAAQGLAVAGLHHPAYAATEAELGRRLDGLLAEGPDAVLLDVGDAAHLAPVGRLLRGAAARRAPLLAVGPSSVLQAWLAAGRAGAAPEPAPFGPAEGPVFVLVGSLSPVTRRQVAAATSYTHLRADPARLVAEPDHLETLAAEVATHLGSGRHVMLRTAPDEGALETAIAPRLADATARLFRAVLGRTGLRRAGIAGGDTSSQATLALGIWGLAYRRTLGPGVTLCRTRSDDPALDGVELMLKGGQMGAEALFESLVHGWPAGASPAGASPG